MKIGNVELKSNIFLAPIAGFSEVGFRQLSAKYGAGLTYTEMVSAKGVYFNNNGTEELLRTSPFESAVAVQLFGSDVKFMYEASKDIRLQKFDIIDINMGCPVRKVFCGGDGSALMKNPTLISEIVAAVKEGSKKPVTVKMRAGIEMDKPLAVDCALAAEKGGADAVAIHPRYRSQFYSGQADHEITRQVKEALHIPVIASGDIVDAESLKRVKAQTNADAFMIARGALGKPYIFSELLNLPYEYSAKDAILEHIAVLEQGLPLSVVANQMKMQLCYYAKGNANAKAVRVASAESKSMEEILEIIEKYF
ncbi:MAG: tRNA-dihydrouridine synthase [Clostridia bacterium]